MTPPDDDDATGEWDARPGLDDTPVDLDEDDVIELDERSLTPPRGVETLPGYEIGRRDAAAEFFAKWDHLLAQERRIGCAEALHAVRAHMLADGATASVADAIIEALAGRIGVKLG